jgi:hypothetical protein
MSLRKICIILVWLFLCSLPAYCCLNPYRSLLNGEITAAESSFSAPYAFYSDKNELKKALREAYNIYKQTGKTEDYSDYGVMLVFDGQLDKAKAIFRQIEASAPGLYATAANIGTTYELLAGTIRLFSGLKGPFRSIPAPMKARNGYT